MDPNLVTDFDWVPKILFWDTQKLTKNSLKQNGKFNKEKGSNFVSQNILQ